MLLYSNTKVNKYSSCYLFLSLSGRWFINKTYRISHRGCSVKKGVLRNFAKVTRKHLRQRLISNKAARLEFFFKNSLWHKCFSVNFAKFLRTLLLQSTTGQLLLSSLLLYYFELLFTAICY